MEDIAIRNIPVREKAFHVLRNAIIKGTLRPGERLVEDNLAEQFEVSRTPLREAIHKLELEGFLVRLPKRGVMVSEISVQEVQELYDVRSYLEGLATRLTVERIRDDEIRELENIKEKTEFYVKNKDREQTLIYSDKLHDFVKMVCRHKVCIEHLDKLHPHIARYRNIAVQYPDRLNFASREHIKIIDFISARLGTEAESAMREHIINSRIVIINSIKKYLANRMD